MLVPNHPRGQFEATPSDSHVVSPKRLVPDCGRLPPPPSGAICLPPRRGEAMIFAICECRFAIGGISNFRFRISDLKSQNRQLPKLSAICDRATERLSSLPIANRKSKIGNAYTL